MRRALRLTLYVIGGLLVLLAGTYIFRGSLLRGVGISFDTGAGGETALLLPDGYDSTVYASGLDSPRFMAIAPDGTLLVAERGADRVVALPDRDDDGISDETVVVGRGYGSAHSLAFEGDGSLLVAGTGTLFRLTLDEDLEETGRESILTYPSGGQHSTRTVLVGPDGSLLVSVGSSCNVCWEEEVERASVIISPPEGRVSRVFMRGLRNAVGLAADPVTGTIWATNNGRDLMGDDLPPETVYRLVEGSDAGWPRCHAGDVLDPDFGGVPDPATGLVGCDGVVHPEFTYQAHAAPLGIAFWREHAVIAMHGSWNRSEKVGYEVIMVPWDDGPAGPPAVLVGGFLDPSNGDASGRPAGVVVGADGALYVSDDKAGFIYRITVQG